MPITVSCTCGQQLRVADQYAGQRVKCPGCGQAVTAPAAAPAAAAPATIKFSCSCGMTMQARAEYAGKTSQCPRCQAKVVIPSAGGSAPPAIQQKPSAPPPKRPAPPPPPPTATTPSTPPPLSKRPAPPPPPLTGRRAAPPAFEEDDDLDFSTPSRSSGGRKARRSGSAMPWILAVGGVLLLVGLGVGGYFIFAKKSPKDGGDGGGSSDPSVATLQYVPGDAQGFVSVRVADIWNSPLGQEAQKKMKKSMPGKDPNEEIVKEMGILPADIERLTFVAVDAQKEVMWIIVATNKPYDKDKILKSGNYPNPTEAKAGDRTYYVRKKWPEENALYFLNDRVFLFAPSSKVMPKAMEYLDGKGGKGPLEGALKLAAEKHALVAGINPPPEILAMGAAQMKPPMDVLKPLFDLKTATVVADLGDGLNLDLSLHFAADDKAAAGKRGLDTGLAILRAALPFVKQGMARSMPPEMVDKVYNQMTTTLNELKIEQKGASVSIQTKVAQESLIAAVNMVQAKSAVAGPGGRPGPGIRPGPGGFPPGGRRPPGRRP